MKKKPVVALLLMAVVFASLLVLNRKDESTSNKEIKVSSDNVFFPEPEPAGNGIPFKNAVPTGLAGINVYWIMQSVVDGDDNCVIYENTTREIHGTRTRSSGQVGDVFTSSTYYPTEKISKTDALDLLDSLCFQGYNG